jgi:hypothetical protein
MSRNVQFWVEAEPKVSGRYICFLCASVYTCLCQLECSFPISFSSVSPTPLEESGTISAMASASEFVHP